MKSTTYLLLSFGYAFAVLQASSLDTSLSSNDTGLGQPLRPDRMPIIEMTPQRVPDQDIPAGPLIHHLLSLIDNFWCSPDNRPLTQDQFYSFREFADIYSGVYPARSSRRVTPINLAWAFDQVVHGVIYSEHYKASKYKMHLYNALLGSVQTWIPPPDSARTSNNMSKNIILTNESSINGPDVRTKFLRTSISKKSATLLFWAILKQIWEQSDKESISKKIEQGHEIDAFWMTADRKDTLTVRFFNLGTEVDPVRWSNVSSRLLKMLQLPAYLDRWELMTSDWFFNDVKFATAWLETEGPDPSEIARNGLDSTSTGIQHLGGGIVA